MNARTLVAAMAQTANVNDDQLVAQIQSEIPPTMTAYGLLSAMLQAVIENGDRTVADLQAEINEINKHPDYNSILEEEWVLALQHVIRYVNWGIIQPGVKSEMIDVEQERIPIFFDNSSRIGAM